MGSFYTGGKHPTCTQNRAVPTHHRTSDAPRWRSRLALDVGEGQKPIRCTLIRLCGDGAESNEAAKMVGSFLHGNKQPSCSQKWAVPTYHHTPDAPRWRSRLAMDVSEGQKQTRCIDSPVRRRGGVE